MMDVVQIFNDELQSLVDMKPPVSKAKMGQITRAAMKGVKFYKHIVQSVEKFVARCNTEYKVPGLYVIDSIVRQSRHQFGIDRDVYASRFSRNLGITFENLFTGCTPEDKSKIVRVLNLWQKNGVFNSHVIQPLLDMASPSTAHQMDPKSPNSVDNNNSTSRQGQTSKYNSKQYSNSNLSSGRHDGSGGLKFSKNMLDFDYDEDDEDDCGETPTEAEPPLSSTLSKIEMETRRKIDKANSLLYQSSQKMNSDQAHPSQQQPKPKPQQQQQQQPPSQDPVLERWNRIIRQQAESNDSLNSSQHFLNSSTRITQRRSRSRSPVTARPQTSSSSSITNSTSYSHQTTSSSSRLLPYATRDSDEDHEKVKAESVERKSTEFQKSSTKTTTQDKERAAERERKCLPKIRDKHLTVCSSTLWLGHVPKTVSEADISDAFGEYGTINSIDLIPPRGCAYVCMDRRQDAKRALNESRDLKLNGSHIKMAWAPGKGFKEYKKLKDFWEANVGASFIPYSRVDESIDFETLEEGGVIDEDSMSMEMRERRERKAKGHLLSSTSIQPTRPPTTTMATTSSGLSLPLPVLPMLNQPPPQPPLSASIQPFAIPPPNLSIPPPVALGQGLIPFPPPGVITSTSSSGPMLAPHLQQQPLPSSSLSSSVSKGEPSQDSDNSEHGSPLSLEQQLSMTERQISMVEQQLNMMQHAQGMGGGPNQGPVPPMSLIQNLPPQAAAMFFQHNQQPNHPMMFDMPGPHQMLPPGMAPMLDPQQVAMFMNHPLNMMGGNQPMIPMSQASMLDPNNMGDMGQHHGGF